jgi:hypothetical protein
MSLILDEVIKDLYKREVKGLHTYGTTLDNANLSKEQLQEHLYEELLDAAMYLKALMKK